MEHNPIGGKNKINFSTSSPYLSTIQQSPYFSTPHILPPYTPYPSTIHPISFHHTPSSILILFEFLSPKILKTFKTLKPLMQCTTLTALCRPQRYVDLTVDVSHKYMKLGHFYDEYSRIALHNLTVYLCVHSTLDRRRVVR